MTWLRSLSDRVLASLERCAEVDAEIARRAAIETTPTLVRVVARAAPVTADSLRRATWIERGR